MNLFMAEVVAGFLIGAGLWFLGFYVGLGMREGRESDQRARIMLARLEAVRAAPPFPFPRPGLLAVDLEPVDLEAVDLGQLADYELPQLPHGPASRPITSPVDLDGAVRLMCLRTELYVAALIACPPTHREDNTHE